MTPMNFIPAHRRALRQQRRRQRVWTAVCTGYAAALAGLALAAWLIVDTGGGDHEAHLRETFTDIEETRLAIDQTKSKLAPARAELLATQSISGRPDWSILLAQVASQLTDDVFLSSVRLDQQAPGQPDRAGPPEKTGSADAYTLTIGGYGRTQAAVSDFVVKLESTPLFERVSILQTNRQTLMADKAISFELACLLSGGQRETH